MFLQQVQPFQECGNALRLSEAALLFRRVLRPFAPFHAQPSQGVEDVLHVLRSAPFRIEVVDPQGRVLASLDRGDAHFDGRIANADVPTETSVLVGEAPVKGTWTLYRTVKDGLAWLAIVVLVGLCGSAVMGRFTGRTVGYQRVVGVN